MVLLEFLLTLWELDASWEKCNWNKQRTLQMVSILTAKTVNDCKQKTHCTVLLSLSECQGPSRF